MPFLVSLNILNSEKEETLAKKLRDAYSTLTLHLYDNILREFDEKHSAFEIQTRLEELYLDQIVPDKIYLKKQLFSFKMDSSKSLD